MTRRSSPPARGGRRRWSVTALLAAVWSAATLGVLYVVCVRTVEGQFHENALHSRALATPDGNGVWWLEQLFSVTTRLEPRHLVVGLVAVAVLGLLRGKPSRAALGVLVAGGTLALTELLKLVVLTRPDLSERYGAFANSLPSGHTSAVLGLALGLVVAAPRFLRTPLALLGAVAAGAMGAFVIDDGWHRVSDVLASALVASTVLCLVLALPSRHRPRTSGIVGLAVGIPVASAVALAVVYAWPGVGMTAAVLVPGAVVALTVLLAARALPPRV